MKHFYHGTSALFDSFDDARVVTNGPNGSCENGHGTYLTADRQWADGWQRRAPGPLAHSKRVNVSDAAWENNFLSHDQGFSKTDAIHLAVAAAQRGYHDVAHHLSGMIRKNQQSSASSFLPALSGKDIAMASRYMPAINRFLGDLGFYGYKYDEKFSNGAKAENAIFFTAKDIPLTTPVDTVLEALNSDHKGYLSFIAEGAKAEKNGGIPADVAVSLQPLFDKIAQESQTRGLPAEKAEAAKADILKLAALGAQQENYDPLKTMHPLKLVETAVSHRIGWQFAQDMKEEIAQTVVKSIAEMGHATAPAALESRPVLSPQEAATSAFHQPGSIHAFRRRLENPDHISSEELSNARWRIEKAHPDLLEKFDRLIDGLHGPGVDFSMRDAMGHAVQRALNGQLTPRGGETTFGNLRENLTYNASGSPVSLGYLIDNAVSFAERLQQKLAPAEPAPKPADTPAAARPAAFKMN